MKSRPILWLSLAILAIWTAAVLHLVFANPAMPTELTPEAYLPAVYRQPTPTPTPTPKPTTVPPGVHIVNDSSFAHSGIGYSVVGEIYNNTTDKYLWNIEVGARFYKNSDQLVNELSDNLDFNSVPDSRVCFALDDSDNEINWDYYELYLDYWDNGTAPPPVHPESVAGTLISDQFIVTGLVYNDYSNKVSSLRVQARLKSIDGTVLDCRQANFYPPPVLESGASTPFQIYFNLRPDAYDDIDRFRVLAQADEYHR